MLGRITTWAFYAAIFFALGAWFGPQPEKMASAANHGWSFTRSSWHMVQGWWNGQNSLHWPESATPEISAQPKGQIATESSAEKAQAPAAAPQASAPAQEPAIIVPKPVPEQPAVTPPVSATSETQVAADVPAPTRGPVDQLLGEARESYARGDVNGALDAYRKVLGVNAQSIPALGEMGNVLFATGQLQEAATAYHKVALLLIGTGRKAEALALEAAIRRGNPDLADDVLGKAGH